jgi:hypothetical protein
MVSADKHAAFPAGNFYDAPFSAGIAQSIAQAHFGCTPLSFLAWLYYLAEKVNPYTTKATGNTEEFSALSSGAKRGICLFSGARKNGRSDTLFGMTIKEKAVRRHFAKAL